MSNNIRFTADDIENKINDYFNYCNENSKPFTMSGLALFLDCSRTTLYNYDKELVKFKDISEDDKQRILNSVKRAKRMVEAYQEEQLFIGKSPVGTIFSLKNNFNWKDAQEINNNTNISAINPIQQLSTEEIKQLLNENKQE